MPDRSKYPPGFDPNYIYLPEPTRPEEEFIQTEDLSVENLSYDMRLDLEDIRRDYPTATHIYIESESSEDDRRAMKVTIERRTTSSNLRYVEHKQRYDAAMVEHRQKRTTWEALSRQWKEEAAAEQRATEYQTYLRLKAQFETVST